MPYHGFGLWIMIKMGHWVMVKIINNVHMLLSPYHVACYYNKIYKPQKIRIFRFVHHVEIHLCTVKHIEII